MSTDPRLNARYSSRRSVASRVFPVVGVGIGIALGVWLVWVIWLKSTPDVTSQLTRWKLVDDHAITAVVQVELSDDAQSPSCLLRATAEDHTTVGELSFTPTDGPNTVTIRTERLATAIDSIGCIARGQDDRR